MNHIFSDEIEKFTEETIINIVIGKWPCWDEEKRTGKILHKDKTNILLRWEEARNYLNYAWDMGYGSSGCHPIVAWTKNTVIFVSEYDGSTQLEKMPRNPQPCEPDMPGGG